MGSSPSSSPFIVNENSGLQFATGFDAASLAALAGSGNISLQDLSSVAVSLTAGGNNSSTTYSGSMSGLGGFTKNGTGAMVLSGNNSYSGSTTVSGGTLVTASPAALSNYNTAGKIAVTNSAALDLLAGNTASYWQPTNVNNLLSSNGAGFASGTFLVIDTTNASSGFNVSGNITAPIGLTKLGANVLTLSGNNTYTGRTTVYAGTLQVGAAHPPAPVR